MREYRIQIRCEVKKIDVPTGCFPKQQIINKKEI